LEVDNGSEDEDGGQQVANVGEVLAEESFAQSQRLILPGDEEMEESKNSTFEFRTTTSVDSGWAECLPDNLFANIRGDARFRSVELLLGWTDLRLTIERYQIPNHIPFAAIRQGE